MTFSLYISEVVVSSASISPSCRTAIIDIVIVIVIAVVIVIVIVIVILSSAYTSVVSIL